MLALLHCIDANDYNGCKRIIDIGIDINERLMSDTTVLHCTVFNLLQLLLSSGANPNHENNLGSTPLHYASSLNRVESIRILIEHNAELEAKNNDGWTPLHSATFCCKPEAIQTLLLLGADPYSTDNYGITVLKRLELMRLSKGDDENYLRCVQIFEEWEFSNLIKEPEQT